MVRKRTSTRSPAPHRHNNNSNNNSSSNNDNNKSKHAANHTLAGVPAVPKAPSQSWKALFSYVHSNDEEPIEHGPVPHHPESPARLENALARLRGNRETWRSLRRLPPRKAIDEEILLCHDEAHLTGLEKLAERAKQDGKPHFLPRCGPVCIRGPAIQDDVEVREGSSVSDTYVTKGSIEVARASIGGLLGLIDAILAGDGDDDDDEEDNAETTIAADQKLHQGLAFCRPPGHHASRNRSSGFCLFNNVAIAASYAMKHYASQVSKVMILDWDVHHGQGTQQIFEWSSNVLVINIHRHDGQDFYPGTGYANDVGLGGGKGYTVNVPLPAGYGGAALWSACSTIVAPAARTFQPDLILISSGFDAAAGDLLGGCSVTPEAFGILTTEMKKLAAELCSGRLVLVLEGGYSLDVLSDCVVEVSKSLVQDTPAGGPLAFDGPMPPSIETAGGGSCLGAVRKVCEVHRNLPLKLPVPPTAAERKRRAASRSCDRIVQEETSNNNSTTTNNNNNSNNDNGKNSTNNSDNNTSNNDLSNSTNSNTSNNNNNTNKTNSNKTSKNGKGVQEKAKPESSPRDEKPANGGGGDVSTAAKASPTPGAKMDKAPKGKTQAESATPQTSKTPVPKAPSPPSSPTPPSTSSAPQSKKPEASASTASEAAKAAATKASEPASPQQEKTPKASVEASPAKKSDQERNGKIASVVEAPPSNAGKASKKDLPAADLELDRFNKVFVVRVDIRAVPRDLAISSKEIWIWPSFEDAKFYNKDILKWHLPQDFIAKVSSEDERRSAKYLKGRGQLKICLRADKYPPHQQEQRQQRQEQAKTKVQRDSGTNRIALVPIEC